MDTETIISSVKKTSRLVTVEEGWIQSGIGAEITAVIAESKSIFCKYYTDAHTQITRDNVYA